MKANLEHFQFSNTPEFASVVQKAFAGVAVLPNTAVMDACLEVMGKNKKPVTIEVTDDGKLRTAYKVVGVVMERGIIIDADTGEFNTYDLDTDEGAEEFANAVKS